jgi:O-antigen/teichoic acid export membrane protein
MGIIEKQATRNAIYSYMGAGLGFITIVGLSHWLSAAENGVIRILISYAALFAQFANLGFTSVTIRIFPYFRDKDKGHHGFLFYAIIVSVIGFFLCWLIFMVLKPHLVQSNLEKSPLFVDYIFYLLPLILFTTFFNIFDSYLRATYNSVIGSLSKEVFQRILILILLVFYFFHISSQNDLPSQRPGTAAQSNDFPLFIFGYMVFTCLPTLILVAYIIKQKEWHVRPVKGFINKELRTEIIKVSIYSILTGSAGAIILNIDAVMVNQFLGEAKTGVYGIAFYFGSILLIPARAIYRITSSIVAEHFKKDELPAIHRLYNKSCNSQLMIGALLFIGIYTNIDNIMHLLPEEYAGGRNVILIISAGYLLEMATGINQVIIANSKHYKYDTYFTFILVGITVVANYIFIPLYGITGSAIATALSSLFVNSMRSGLLYYKYKMQPYDMNTLKLVIISVIAFLPGYFIPDMHSIFIDIPVRSAVVGTLFIALTYLWDAAPELNNKIRKNLHHIGIK